MAAPPCPWPVARDHEARRLHRDGEADALRTSGDGGVDADDLPVEVEHGPARVAGIDGGIGLKELDAIADGDRTLEGRDAGRDGRGKAERTADRHDPLADPDRPAFAKASVGRPLASIETRAKIRFRILADHASLEAAPVGQGHGDGRDALGDVIVGHNQALGIDHEAGSHSFCSK